MNGGLFPERLTDGDFRPDVAAYYFKEWNGFRMGYHTHRATEIMYVIGGTCSVELLPGGHTDKIELTLTKGEFIVLDANVPHRLIVEGTCRMLNLEFRFAERDGLVPPVGRLALEEKTVRQLLACPQSFVVLRDPHDFQQALKSLVLELDASPSGNGPMTELLFGQLLLLLARLYHLSSADGSGVQERYIRLCIRFMHQHYDLNLTVPEIAASVNLHPGYLQRIFKRSVGMPLMSYLTAFRMERAKMLLRQTAIPVADIADYVGVGSRQYFHLLFRKHAGMTPVDYRKSASTHHYDDDEYYESENF